MQVRVEITQSLLTPGEAVAGKYRVDRVIGRGGMAEVYAAYHEILQQTVALKVLLPGIADSPDASTRFLNEARSAARIRGEHVAAVMDVGTLPSGAAYMVLEYLEGRDLEVHAEQHAPLPPGEAVDYVLDALQAIAQAHALGIVHRDLKPSNLFLARRPDGSSVVKVLDFGISKVSRSPGSQSIDPSVTSSQAVLGSPFYMSPEQARSAKSVDLRTDIWAIGVILHRLLTRALPFMGETLTELLLAIVQQEPPPIRQLRPELPEGLEAIVLRCLRKNPAERFANVGELASALLPFAGGEHNAAVARIGRTLAVHTPAQAFPNPVSALAASAPGGAVPGPGTNSSWAEASRARSAKRTSLLRPAMLVGGGAATAIIALGVVLLVSRGGSKDSTVSHAPAATGIAQEPPAIPPAPSVSAGLAPVESAAPLAPSASASAAPSAVPTPSVSPARPAAKPVSPAARPTATYDLLNQRN